MPVTIYERVLPSGNKTLMLDINHHGKRKKEFLNLILKKGKKPEIKEQNKTKRLLAEEIRAKREIELISEDYEIKDKSKKNLDFIDFFDDYVKNYNKSDNRLVKASYDKFVEFLKSSSIKTITLKHVDKEICENFHRYLNQNLNGETPYDYFKKFRAVLAKAVDKEYISKNPSKDIKNVRVAGLKKSILYPEEIQKLASAYCGNDNVKRAFLFCLNTGLRLCDTKTLKWKQIANGQITYIQGKTDTTSSKAQVTVDLNENAKQLIGKPKNLEDFVFDLPSSTNGCNKSLKNWVKKAEINKKITWHCARHSLAVNLLRADVGNSDIKTVSSVLGHSSIRSTEIYTHVVDELKKKAVNALPNINLN